jgi:hypothetical protein
MPYGQGSEIECVENKKAPTETARLRDSMDAFVRWSVRVADRMFAAGQAVEPPTKRLANRTRARARPAVGPLISAVASG